jgi:FtsH-binding integral membrane protein
MEENTKNREGLGGWLILVGIGIITSPFVNLIYQYNYIFVKDGEWKFLTTPGTAGYHPFWSVILIFETLGNAVIIFFGFYLIFLFFKKNKNFPKYFIRLYIFAALFILIDVIVVNMVLPNEPLFSEEDANRFLHAVMNCLIWIPYIYLSKRVKATFIR